MRHSHFQFHPHSPSANIEMCSFGPFGLVLKAPKYATGQKRSRGKSSVKSRFQSRRICKGFDSGSDRNSPTPKNFRFLSKSVFGSTFLFERDQSKMEICLKGNSEMTRESPSFESLFRKEIDRKKSVSSANSLNLPIIWNLKRVKTNKGDLIEFREGADEMNQKSSPQVNFQNYLTKTLTMTKVAKSIENQLKFKTSMQMNTNPKQIEPTNKQRASDHSSQTPNHAKSKLEEDNLTVETRCNSKVIDREIDSVISRSVKRVKKDPEKIPLDSQPRNLYSRYSHQANEIGLMKGVCQTGNNNCLDIDIAFGEGSVWKTETFILKGENVYINTLELERSVVDPEKRTIKERVGLIDCSDLIIPRVENGHCFRNSKAVEGEKNSLTEEKKVGRIFGEVQTVKSVEMSRSILENICNLQNNVSNGEKKVSYFEKDTKQGKIEWLQSISELLYVLIHLIYDVYKK